MNDERLDKLLAMRPPITADPAFAGRVVGRLRRAAWIRHGVITAFILAGAVLSLSLISFEFVGTLFGTFSGLGGLVNFEMPELSTGNLIAGAVVGLLFVISLMAVQEDT